MMFEGITCMNYRERNLLSIKEDVVIEPVVLQDVRTHQIQLLSDEPV